MTGEQMRKKAGQKKGEKSNQSGGKEEKGVKEQRMDGRKGNKMTLGYESGLG